MSIELRDEDRTVCEVWSRVMGYHRPISAYNPGKLCEHRERKYFREPAFAKMKACPTGVT